MTRLVLGVDGRLCLSSDSSQPPCSTSTEPVAVRSVSVTQVNDFNRCPRRWFFKKVRQVEVPEKPTDSKAIGRDIHWLIERYYKSGTMPVGHVHAEKAMAAVAYLPQPQPTGLLVEHRFSLNPEDGLPKFTGVIDLVDVRRDDAVRLIDHKTSSKYNELVQKPVDVANDPQMLTYAEWSFMAYPERSVEVAHNRISTKHVARASLGEWAQIPREAAKTNWDRMRGLTRNMVDLASAPPADWNDVPCNTDACGDYGGCDFLPICSLKTPTIGVKMAADENAASDLLARLAKLTGATASPQVVSGDPAASVTMPNTVIGLVVPVGSTAVEPVALLPPDAPSRMTPAVEEPTPTVKATKKPRKKAEDRWEYEIDRITTKIDEGLLNERGADGWELVGFFDGVDAIWKRRAA